MSEPISLKEAGQPTTSCRDCGLFDLCFAQDVAESRRDDLDRIIRRQRPLGRDVHLFHAGQKLKSICVVRSGTVKTYQISRDGDEIVTGFHLPGELIGLDAIGNEAHPEFAVALEDSRYCEIPYRELQKILDDSPDLNHLLLKLLSIDMAETRELMLVINRLDARARVATFLLNLSRRLTRRGKDGDRFRLAMDRRDIANYLGLTIETVSRTLSWMQKQGMLAVRGKLVSIVESDALLDVAGREHEDLVAGTG
ncbi:fumarate/nitrate reduction transcriptional regulator Fnr [Wenzhouxiangella sp. XN79A]|uniref:fumarate/nitrate reduction transcriptional regulator Fnr n=1 Tax=Wenzhouxiangella sp. XN79A TaxID=2724193 RepID=UPI00144AAC4B|nr:fumarate/nitrate reduction transcriptional regulator Fnr [Wenzhouxiangella sp. XN79A]NKI35389.1 fumarate/nitrate reduction transcriptional regulator Fnr [Wenzhouxiangella sp. XN79A]